MKSALYGTITAAFSAFLFMGGASKETYTEQVEIIPQVPTTEQLIEKTALYKKVEKFEHTLDSLENEKINTRLTNESR